MEPLVDPDRVMPRVDKRSLWTLLLVVSVVALIAVLSFGAGILAERRLFSEPWLSSGRLVGGIGDESDTLTDAAFPRQAEVRKLIEDEYFFLPASPEAQQAFVSDLDQGAMKAMAVAAATPAASLDDYRRQLDFAAARGMTEVLSDDYTVFLEPVQDAPLKEELAGQYEGIGVWVEHPEGTFTIVSPIMGSPAERAGLQPGDVIIAADGKALEGLEPNAAMSLIRGPAGTSINLTVRRNGVVDPFEVAVKREAIVIPAVVYDTQADGKVAHIRVTIFGDNTTKELDEALRRAKTDGVSGIVLDLRGNGGGWVTSAEEMIGRFLPADSGPALYQDLEAADDNELQPEPIVGGGEDTFDLPLVVLVDGGTASASEIVAGAIRDYDRGILVGEATFGKGLVQRVHDFNDGSSARISFARWLTPDKIPIPDSGLQPDIEVKPAAPESESDPQLDRAVQEVMSPASGTPAGS
jgi:carboxyl-terminal processing protease